MVLGIKFFYSNVCSNYQLQTVSRSAMTTLNIHIGSINNSRNTTILAVVGTYFIELALLRHAVSTFLLSFRSK